ncbi:MAG TPA: hypothetical protein VKE51_34405 [Vicinamibacterales bacterium]|nr:hypothetical protein [Vicinamibacterales bacterium]
MAAQITPLFRGNAGTNLSSVPGALQTSLANSIGLTSGLRVYCGAKRVASAESLGLKRRDGRLQQRATPPSTGHDSDHDHDRENFRRHSLTI